ncbi:MAG TPA: bifunctional phosphoglucose/phosphomannose isomerase [Aggregatilinea sp.]|uniref:bifunctional phosphoglucose/phosphomannose isomerase n=1 Tax=Aggregatilinea sp. TaxID=2806333 RepID=UPI002CF56776|nr:bifunctional phosphoglucose/phosphomannose isomerase [Aggregatilinea sp.]HML21306.1 bifunctional phosphoglucose/phosphomannose isomerase [Aggregatilinea sp.]
MNLDDMNLLRDIDKDDMLFHVNNFANQLEQAWTLAATLPLPESHRQPRQIVVCGMGGSAIGGDLTAALIAGTSPVPFSVVRGYDLPAYINGPETLVIASSFSGGTEETLAAVEQAVERGATLLAITTGGKLAAHAEKHGYPLWQFDYKSQPRAALGWSFGMLMGLVYRLGYAPTLDTDLHEGIALLREFQPEYAPENPAATNPAKRGAGQLMGRIPMFIGSGAFEPVARRWKGQLNENAKVWGCWEPMPEMNHNAVVGIEHPDDLMRHVCTVFISSPQFDHPRVALRNQLTYTLFLEHGIMTDRFQPQGSSLLAQMLHAIQYGDYLSYYAAIGTKTDPTTIAPIVELKSLMAERA